MDYTLRYVDVYIHIPSTAVRDRPRLGRRWSSSGGRAVRRRVGSGTCRRHTMKN